jgi:hypothetical protein
MSGMAARLWPLVLFLWGVVPWAGAQAAPDGPKEEPPVLEEDADRPAGVEGALRLSDGKLLRGKISFPDGAKLRVYDARTRRAYDLDLAQVAAVRTVVEREAMEEAWTFEEEGFRKKVKLGWQYPLRNYGQEVELREGPVIVGHLYAATVYISDGKEERRLMEGLWALAKAVVMALCTVGYLVCGPLQVPERVEAASLLL